VRARTKGNSGGGGGGGGGRREATAPARGGANRAAAGPPALHGALGGRPALCPQKVGQKKLAEVMAEELPLPRGPMKTFSNPRCRAILFLAWSRWRPLRPLDTAPGSSCHTPHRDNHPTHDPPRHRAHASRPALHLTRVRRSHKRSTDRARSRYTRRLLAPALNPLTIQHGRYGFGNIIAAATTSRHTTDSIHLSTLRDCTLPHDPLRRKARARRTRCATARGVPAHFPCHRH
jgi:hypothetical protein